MHHPTDRIAHTPVVEHWLGREIAQWDEAERLISAPHITLTNSDVIIGCRIVFRFWCLLR